MPYLAIASCLLLLAQQSLDTWLYAGAIALVGGLFYVVNFLLRRRFDQPLTPAGQERIAPGQD
jgi:hypothetical protein